MKNTSPQLGILAACCAAIFWPGTLVFGFPGVLNNHWQTTFAIGSGAVGRIMFLILVPVGCFMFLFGKLLERWRPARLVSIGALTGFVCTLLLPFARSFASVYLWAFMMGSATAMTYLSGLTVTQHWFPRHRGLISGVFNLCFGGSAALISPLYSWLLHHYGYTVVAMFASACVLFFGLVTAPFIRFPSANEAISSTPSTPPSGPIAVSMTVVQSLKTRSFWMLWLTWALAGAAGISMVPLAPAFGQARGLSPQEAVLILMAFNLTNGASRLISGYVSDFLGRKSTLTVAFIMAGSSYLLMDQAEALVWWAVLAAVIGYAFGTLFAVSAPLVGDCFGMDHFGAIIGVVFTAYGFISGVIGPGLSGYLLDATNGNFRVVFSYLGIFYLLAAGMILLTRPKTECVLPVL